MGDFLIIPCLNCIKITQKQAWRPLIYFAWMKSMYFREYVCRFSRKFHYFCILGVSHLKESSSVPGASFFSHGLTSVATRINNHTHSKIYNEIAHPLQRFNYTIVVCWKWISNFILHFIMGMNTRFVARAWYCGAAYGHFLYLHE